MPRAFFDWDRAHLEWRRRLPHVTQPDAIYFVTFRVADSIPAVRLAQWKREVDAWKAANYPPLTEDQEERYANLGYRRIERWLDQGEGSCPLADAAAAGEIQRCLRHCDRSEYRLGDFVVMPNHVHVLVQMLDGRKLRSIVDTWQDVTTHKINRLLSRHGTLWQDDWFDHIVRDVAALARIREYVQKNAASVGKRALLGGGSLSE
jgi:REP element-mobilizing transposase RayT